MNCLFQNLIGSSSTILIFAACSVVARNDAQAQKLISSGADWKYFKGATEASTPDTSFWRSKDFGDQNWGVAPTPFYYGESFASGFEIQDMRSNYSTLFLRKTIEVVDDPSRWTRVTVRSRVDDGFVLWVNGIQVQRRNAPDDPLRYNQTAPSGATEPVNWVAFNLNTPASVFRKGSNIVAVQVFNVALTSSDLVFDVELDVLQPDQLPPTLVSITPGPGIVSSLNEVTLVFDEPVNGVDRTDLMLNEFPALDVQASGDRKTFRFTMPGTVNTSSTINWDPNHGIHDDSSIANPFDHTQSGAPWVYKVVDTEAPKIRKTFPLPNSTLSQLNEIALTFNEPVQSVRAANLLVNGVPALSVQGEGVGPYVFKLDSSELSGEALVELISTSNEGSISDYAEPANFLESVSWSYEIDPDLPTPKIRINEIHAANLDGLKDEDGDAEDWLEIWNYGDSSVRLLGWTLTDDSTQPDQWAFPDITLNPGSRLVVFTSAKNRSENTFGSKLHTNFKLGSNGETISLFKAESPPHLVDSMSYPEQRNNISFGYVNDLDSLAYFQSPTPGQPNKNASFLGVWPEPDFNAERGYYDNPVNVYMTSLPGSEIRYTLDGSEPTATNGTLYNAPLAIQSTTILRAAVFSANQNDQRLPSKVVTHSYLYRLNSRMKSLPVISLVTDRSNLFGRSGIMETNPRNTTQRGALWERPVSAEWIQADGSLGFQVDCGLRVQGGDYVRGRYSPNGGLPFSKYSFRLYFRGEYGPGKLQFPFLGSTSPIQEFDTLSLRAGMNDHTNPFISDELTRRMFFEMGNVSSRGRFAHLFLNGEYKGYYNPAERIDPDFLRSWRGGGDAWDLVAQFGEIREGDNVAWNQLNRTILQSDPASSSTYSDVDEQLDLTNFIDYLLLNAYTATGDWPHNNWRIARERAPGDAGRFRYMVWDAEWSFGFSNPISHNTFINELNRDSEVARFYQRLKNNEEFRLKFADRVEKHLIQSDGVLHLNQMNELFRATHGEILGALPRLQISYPSWMSRRPGILISHLRSQGLLSTTASPKLRPDRGQVFAGEPIEITSADEVFFTINGPDPRQPISGALHPDAARYNEPLILQQDSVIRVRSRLNGVWSALVEAEFIVGAPAHPITISEIQYNPLGGRDYEFIELINLSGIAVNLSKAVLNGVDFTFPLGASIEPGEIIVLASSQNPNAFQERYPSARVYGYFQGSLANNGETLTLIGVDGQEIFSISYSDGAGWPTQADGSRNSLTRTGFQNDPSRPGSWTASGALDGTPGVIESVEQPNSIVISEIMAGNTSAVENQGEFPDWIELWNHTAETINLQGWSVSDAGGNNEVWTFPEFLELDPDQRLALWMTDSAAVDGLKTGFALNRSGDLVALLDPQGRRVDVVSFGSQIEDFSISRDSRGDWILTQPTPGAPHGDDLPAMGNASDIRLNEWMADSLPGETDWLEVFNTSELPVSLLGLHVTVNGVTRQILDPTFISASGFVDWTLNGDHLPGQLDMKIPAEGATISISDIFGMDIDSVTFNAQLEGVSQGRAPDGSGPIVSFQISPTKGRSNSSTLAEGPFISEVLARNNGGDTGSDTDWIEIYNPLNQEVSLAGWSLSLNQPQRGEWIFPDSTVIAATGYLIVEASTDRPDIDPPSLNQLNIGQNLPGQGAKLYLFNPEEQLAQRVEYGYQIAGFSFGSINLSKTLMGLLETPTPGAANAPRASMGSPISIRFNEWISAPTAGEDWLELYNPSDDPVDLGGLWITDDGSVAGSQKLQISPLSYLDAKSWIRLDSGSDLNFSMDSRGESLRLYQNNGVGLVDAIDFGPLPVGVSEGFYPDGSSSRTSMKFPTPGYANDVFADQDSDGIPDAWEILYGLNPSDPSDASGDKDGDGANELQEFLAGTDPTVSDDFPGLFWIETQTTGRLLSFIAIPGKSYILESTSSLDTPVSWNARESWPNTTSRQTIEWSDPDLKNEDMAIANRWYRLIIE